MSDSTPSSGDDRDVVLVTGATGYVGGRLVPELLAAGHRVRCLARTPEKLDGFPWRGDVEVVKGDVTDEASIREAMAGCRAAYFLVHSMGGPSDFAERDRQAAASFRDAAGATDGMERLVYLGGLGDDDDPGLSAHLQSRHEVGRVLADGPVPVTELRAAVVIGSGSASFEMLRHLVETLPAMITPRWVHTRCQPIAVRDVLAYLVGAIDAPAVRDADDLVLEIGGPDVLTYAEMMRTFAAVAGLPKRLMIRVPILGPRLSAHWVNLVTPIPRTLAAPLIESIVNEVVVTDRRVEEFIPHRTLPFRTAVELAIRRVEHLDVATTWSSAGLPGRSPADPLPTDPDWAGGLVLCDQQEVSADAPPATLFDAVSGVGGGRGWYVADVLWGLRGFLDRLLGGIGSRRGRRHPDELRVGDALDFWRVERYVRPATSDADVVEPADAPTGNPVDEAHHARDQAPGPSPAPVTGPPPDAPDDGDDDHDDVGPGEGLLRLRAEMRIPGRAWLEWRITPSDDGRRSTLHQRALFHPAGLAGRAYWYVMLPFHGFIFRPMARELAGEGERRARLLDGGADRGAGRRVAVLPPAGPAPPEPNGSEPVAAAGQGPSGSSSSNR